MILDDNKAIVVKDLYKTFRLPHEQHSGIKQHIINIFKGVKGYEDLKVLNNISFEIEKGDFFGIVGRNGSGKSTLLKLLAGIYVPDKGSIKVNGSLTPFIELGVGFNSELTGRENIYLNGALLGFSKTEMEGMYDEIVEFAELKQFMDQKLKNYSSGMQVRLAFSIAIRANSDILVLDEVLAVGDEAFQRKCFNYFDQLKRDKKTVVLVTHDMNSVERFCNRAIFIDDGVIKLEGKPHKVAASYSHSNEVGYSKSINTRSKNKSEFQIEIYDNNGEITNSLNCMDTMSVKLKWTQPKVKNVGVAIFRDNGEYVFGPNTYQDKYIMKNSNEAEYQVKLNLGEGEYFLKAGLMGDKDTETIAFIEEGPHFIINRNYNTGRWGGITSLDHKWLS